MGEKVNKQGRQDAAKNWVEINFSRVLFSFFVTFSVRLTPSAPNIYLIDFRTVASPRYEFPSPLDHAPQSSERYAGPKIRCHLKMERKSGH